MTKSQENSDIRGESKNRKTKYNRRKIWGDRRDGWILKDLSSFTNLVPHLMTSRNASAVYFKEKVDVTRFVKYVQEKNKELSTHPLETKEGPITKITYFNVFLAALVRLFTVKPHMNRFIASRKYYQRKKIELAFVAKKEFTEDGGETTIKKSFSRDETLWSIVSRLTKGIKMAKTEETDDATDIMDVFARLPGPILHLAISFLNFLDYMGHYPKSIYDEDPMHASAFIANLGSIGLKNVPYHHLYDRGTTSVFICLGKIYPEETQDETGASKKYFVEISTTIDERISDGFYYISAMNQFKEILNHPELLEEELEDYPVDQ